jgi:ornithine cyclodeaminase/alanine dehydrogenase
MLYLNKRDIQNMGVTMAQVLEAVGEGLRLKGLGMVQMPPKAVVRPVADSFLHAMPVHVQGSEVCGIKWMSGFSGNVAKGLPYINGLLILNDSSTGVPVAVMDCAEITAMRTGAIVGIAAKHLAREDSSVLGILGCGVQARKSLIALMEVLPRLALVRCHDIVPEAATQFVGEMEALFPLTSFVICDTPADMAHFADVVITATPIVDNPNPSLGVGMLKAGGLAIALDYDASWSPEAMRECDKIVVDDSEQFSFTKRQGIHFTSMPDNIHADLGDITAGSKPGRENDSEQIICLNLGIAVADIVAAKVLYDRALRQGIGQKLTL